MLLPVFVQSKVEGEIDAFGLLSQISLTDAITSDKEIEALPLASRSTGAMFETATIVGAVASTTFTVAVSVVTFPEASVAVTVTVGVVPASEHVNELGEIVTEETLQLSAVASTTCDGWMVTEPETPTLILAKLFNSVIVGFVLSTISTSFVAVDTFPEASSEVIVMVCVVPA